MKVIKVGLSAFETRKIIKKCSSKELDKRFIDCLWEYVIFNKNINRSFVTCPFCNENHSFHKMYNLKNSKECKLIYNYKGAEVKVGNSMMFIVSGDGKMMYEIPDLYFHFFYEHNLVPKDTFKNIVIHGIKPGTDEYFEKIKKYFLNRKERELIKKNKLIVKGINCSICEREIQGEIAYRVTEKCNEKISSYICYPNIDSTEEIKYKYICYMCGHYV